MLSALHRAVQCAVKIRQFSDVVTVTTKSLDHLDHLDHLDIFTVTQCYKKYKILILYESLI